MKQLLRYLVLILVSILLMACQKTSGNLAESVGQSGEETRAAEDVLTETTGADSSTDFKGTELAESTSPQSMTYNDELYYSHHNGLVYDNKIYIGQSSDNSYVSGIHIKGLQDSEVQARINDRIKAEALTLYEQGLPPYRGIYTIVSESNNDMLIQTVNGRVYYNNANILSMVLSKYIHNSDESISISSHTPLTFDLSTGELLTLSDLFTPDTDYQKALSDYVSSQIPDNSLYESIWDGYHGYRDEEPFALIRPFDQIKETQKFVISSNEEIMLLLDYDTPEFDVNLHTIFLPIDDNLLKKTGARFAYAAKYGGFGLDLYAPGYEREMLLIDDYRNYTTGEVLNFTEEDDGMGEIFLGKDFHIRFYINKDADYADMAGVINEIVARPAVRVMAALDDAGVELDDCISFNYEYNVNKYGHYFNEREWYSVNFCNNEEQRGYIYKVYDTLTGQQIYLKDCFIPGFDYVNALTDAILKQSSWRTVDEIQEILVNPGFSIDRSRLIIYCSDGDNIYVSYTALGEENLTLFD